MPSSSARRLLASLPATRPSFSALLWDKSQKHHGTAAKLMKLALSELVVYPDPPIGPGAFPKAPGLFHFVQHAMLHPIVFCFA